MLVALLAVIVFLFESLSPTSAATGDATLRLGFKPCEPKDASCHNAEVFVKDSFTVAVEMKTFHIPNGLGYDAWEADVCFPRNELAFSRLTFEGGPQGKQVSFGPTPVDVTDDCVTLGAAVGPGEGASQDFGNLANLDFTCKRASEDIELELTSGLVILGNNDSKEVAQGPAQVVVDCGAGSMSAIASGGFLTELVDENNPYAGVQIHAKAGEKFEVAISIDELTNLADKDNPGDGGGQRPSRRRGGS